MNAAFWDAWKDAFTALPVLILVYILLEIMERKYEHVIRNLISSSRRAGPFLGALLGLIPQCGFSVITTVLFTRRVVSLGTLIAVYIATADEAVPVILAQPEKIALIPPLLATKFLIAVVAGYVIDFLVKFNRSPEERREDTHDCHTESKHCCGVGHTCREPWHRAFLFLPAWHALRIFFFIFAVSLGLNLLITYWGEEKMSAFLLGHSLRQPVITVLVGLVPNCAASVIITQIYLRGALSFGSVIAGLSASAGLGMLVLLREHKNRREAFLIVGILAGISLAAGLLLDLLHPDSYLAGG